MGIVGGLCRGGCELRRLLGAGALRECALGSLGAEGGGSDTEERDTRIAGGDDDGGAGQCEIAAPACDLREPVAGSGRRGGQPQLRQQLAVVGARS